MKLTIQQRKQLKNLPEVKQQRHDCAVLLNNWRNAINKHDSDGAFIACTAYMTLNDTLIEKRIRKL